MAAMADEERESARKKAEEEAARLEKEAVERAAVEAKVYKPETLH